MTGSPKAPQKRAKRTAKTAQLDVVQPSDPKGDVNDPTSLAYWRNYDKKTKGQLVRRFCYELHEHVINTCGANFPTAGTDPKLQSMEHSARAWYLRQPKSNWTGRHIDIWNYLYDMTMV